VASTILVEEEIFLTGEMTKECLEADEDTTFPDK
jgi:hypothetical protein